MARPKTIKGRPVVAGLEHLVPHRHTDEGVEEFNQGKETARVTIVSDPFEKLLAQHENSPADQPWQHTDPVDTLVRQHGKPEMAHRLLAENIVKQRGMRGYVPVRDRDGNLVRLGDSVLAEMPKEHAEKRDRFYQEESAGAVQKAREESMEKQAQLVHDSKAAGISLLEPNQVVQDVNDRSHVMQTGLQIDRGIPT